MSPRDNLVRLATRVSSMLSTTRPGQHQADLPKLAPLRAELERLRGAEPVPDELDTGAAAKLAGVSRDTVREWVRRRGLPARRPAGTRDFRIARADLLAFLAVPAKRRPPRERGPVDLSAEAAKMLERSRRR